MPPGWGGRDNTISTQQGKSGKQHPPVALANHLSARTQHGLFCAQRKQLLEIFWFVWTFTVCASFPRKAMNFEQKCLWFYTAHSTVARPLLSCLSLSPCVFLRHHHKGLSSKQNEGRYSGGAKQQKQLVMQSVKLKYKGQDVPRLAQTYSSKLGPVFLE